MSSACNGPVGMGRCACTRTVLELAQCPERLCNAGNPYTCLCGHGFSSHTVNSQLQTAAPAVVAPSAAMAHSTASSNASMEISQPDAEGAQKKRKFDPAGESSNPSGASALPPVTFSTNASGRPILSLSRLQYHVIARSALSFVELSDDDIDNGFKSDDQIGEGAYGRVYRAMYTPAAGVAPFGVAVKVMQMPSELRRRFLKEVAQMQLISRDPQALQLFGALEDAASQRCYIVMELMPLGDLEGFIERLSELSWDQILELTQSMADALERLHRSGVLHCDFKPSNLLVWRDDSDAQRPVYRVKVSDLGQSKALFTTRTVVMPSNRIVHRASAGTPAYAAPEWINGEENDFTPAMDVYSLTMSIYHLLSRSAPWGQRLGSRIQELVHAGKRPSLAFLTRLPPSWVVHVRDVLELGWRIPGTARPTAASMARKLRLIIEQVDIDAAIETVVQSTISSYGHARQVMGEFMRKELPLTPAQAHRLMAAQMARMDDKPESVAFRRRWRIPDMNSRAGNQLGSELAQEFYDRYFDDVNDDDLETRFRSQCGVTAPDRPRIPQLRPELETLDSVAGTRVETDPAALFQHPGAQQGEPAAASAATARK